MIKKLISALPEIYQPIHGHPDLSDDVSRTCFDRLEHIARIHDTLRGLLGRPLKVLDLGCAQGYFSLNLAERGAIVHGVDFLDKNIAVCNALAQEHPALNVSFETGRVEDAIADLFPGQYDLVLVLSVVHHIVYEKGAQAVKSMLERAAEVSGVLIAELALREEPLYWAPAQPEDARALLDDIPFVHEVARHGTHLAPIPRPLFVASNRYWILGNQAARFDDWSRDPHALAHGTHQGSRRYFFGSDLIMKLYRLDHPRGEYNQAEFTREVSFLTQPPAAFSAPQLVTHGERNTEAWLAMQRLPGRLLLDLLRSDATFDKRAVLLAVLQQLATLEAAGVYHNDVRSWNVIVAEDGAAHLIDYGSISPLAQDCAWPENPFLSFLIFVHEVTTGVFDDPIPLRTIAISPYGLTQPYRDWANSLWSRPMTEWTFQLMYETLQSAPMQELKGTLEQPINAWMKAIEGAIEAQARYSHRLEIQTEGLAHQAEHILRQVQQAESIARQAEVKAQDLEAKAAETGMLFEQRLTKTEQTLQHLQHRADAYEQQVQAMLDSTSWRITAPLRWMGIQVRLLKQHGLKSRLTSLRNKDWLRAQDTPTTGTSAPDQSKPPEVALNEAPPVPEPMSVRTQQTYDQLTNAIPTSSTKD